MSCYISSNNERIYVALESTYGMVPAITIQNRIPLVKLTAKQVPEQTSRSDKTGTRTFVGLPNTIRENDELSTQHVDDGVDEPDRSSRVMGRCFRRRWAGRRCSVTGGTVASVTNQTEIQFTAAHGLSAGQAVTFSGEMRFVAAIEDTTTIFMNAPFTNVPTAGSAFGTTMTYALAESLGSVSIFDYWDPSDGGAEDRRRRGDGHDEDQGQRRLSGVRFSRDRRGIWWTARVSRAGRAG